MRTFFFVGFTALIGFTVTVLAVSTGLAETCEVRAAGRCDLPKHDRLNPLDVDLAGRLQYRARIALSPFTDDEWRINPQLDITNASGGVLFAEYYVAFFDAK